MREVVDHQPVCQRSVQRGLQLDGRRGLRDEGRRVEGWASGVCCTRVVFVFLRFLLSGGNRALHIHMLTGVLLLLLLYVLRRVRVNAYYSNFSLGRSRVIDATQAVLLTTRIGKARQIPKRGTFLLLASWSLSEITINVIAIRVFNGLG